MKGETLNLHREINSILRGPTLSTSRHSDSKSRNQDQSCNPAIQPFFSNEILNQRLQPKSYSKTGKNKYDTDSKGERFVSSPHIGRSQSDHRDD